MAYLISLQIIRWGHLRTGHRQGVVGEHLDTPNL
jgi:hypothetical protein